MGVFVPALPIPLPPRGVRVFHGYEKGSVTRVGGCVEDATHAEVCDHFRASLEAGGWSVPGPCSAPATRLHARRGTAQLDVVINGPTASYPVDFDVIWTR